MNEIEGMGWGGLKIIFGGAAACRKELIAFNDDDDV
jgi:hypothetical protein